MYARFKGKVNFDGARELYILMGEKIRLSLETGDAVSVTSDNIWRLGNLQNKAERVYLSVFKSRQVISVIGAVPLEN